MEIKNYIELCKLLDEKRTQGDSRRAQINNWKRYFKFKREGHRYIILEIYDKPIEKQENRGGARDIVSYIENIERLMLSILIQEKNKNEVTLSKNALFKVLHMVNENYSECSQIIPSLSEFTKIDIQDIEEFYQSTGSMLKGNLHRALENLRKRKMIFWQPVIMINALEVSDVHNDLNKIKLEEFSKGYDRDGREIVGYRTISEEALSTFREATRDEYEFIMKTESDIIKEMGYVNEQEIVIADRWNEYKERVNAILVERANVRFYYEAYRIIMNREKVQNEGIKIVNTNDNIERELINKGIIERTNKLAAGRHERAKNGNSNIKNETIERRLDKDYVSNQSKLSEILIDRNYKKNIIEEIEKGTR